jgi:hypothetical protein
MAQQITVRQADYPPIEIWEVLLNKNGRRVRI